MTLLCEFARWYYFSRYLLSTNIRQIQYPEVDQAENFVFGNAEDQTGNEIVDLELYIRT